MQQIRISLDTKFQRKVIILIFLTKGAIFLGAMAHLGHAMALVGQSRESWPSMAPLGYVENPQTKMIWHFKAK